ncbi:MAG: HesA/MoeB/ThiF family protein [Candidatus Woesearchaeota archaeon]
MRYLRQEKLKEIGKKGQQKVNQAKIAIVGIGALGTITSELLLRAGVKNLLLIDPDTVSILNLHRQTFFEKDLDKNKAKAMRQKLKKIDSNANIKISTKLLTNKNTNILKNYDLILDCTDNMKARHTINDYCQKTKKTWIHAAGSSTIGNILVVNNYEKFRKLFNKPTLDRCEEVGVINTLTTTIASLQVTQAIKIIIGHKYEENLVRLNIWENEVKKIKW